MFCLLNLIPLAAVIVLGILWYRGDIVFNQLPEGTGATLGILAGLLVVIFLVASFSIPISHDAVKAVGLALSRKRAIIKGQEEGSRILAVLLFPFNWIFLLFTALLRMLLMLLALVLMGVFGIFCVRLFKPEFLQEWIDKAFAWING